MEECTSVPIGCPWDTMKPLGSHMTIERTNRRQEQQFRMTLKRGSFTGRYVPLKCRLTFNGLHGVISHIYIIIAAVRTSHPTIILLSFLFPSHIIAPCWIAHHSLVHLIIASLPFTIYCQIYIFTSASEIPQSY
jgi:hypothetical protein